MSNNFLETNLWDDRSFINEDASDGQVEEQDQFEDNQEELFVDEAPVTEDSIEEDVEQEDVVNNARTRLEQGRLYELLINHNLFDGVEADPKAVSRVEKEIKAFITERLEILLGMRAEKERVEKNVQYQSPFNEIEVQALKMMAATVTKGASKKEQQPVNNQPAQKPAALNTVKQKKVEQPSLNTVTQAKPQVKPQPQINRQQPAKPQPQKAVQSKKVTNIPPKTSDTIVSAAKNDIKYLEGLKQLSLEEANKVVSERHRRPVPVLTNMSQDTVNSHYTNKAALNDSANLWGAILKKAKVTNNEE